MTEPKRVIQGRETRIEYNNGLYIDPDNGDSYSVESDTGDQMVVFGRDADGNVAPKRILYIPHRSYSLAVDEARDELYITVEYPPQVVVYRKEAALNEQPLRRIRGDATLMATPHGIAIDEKNQLLFVNNWGHTVSFDGSPVRSACCRNQEVPAGNPGTGHYVPPSITVYPLDAEGAVAPLRVIQGDRTGFNWPGNMKVDQDTGDLYLANDVDHLRPGLHGNDLHKRQCAADANPERRPDRSVLSDGGVCRHDESGVVGVKLGECVGPRCIR